jgi:predicted ester cyclase
MAQTRTDLARTTEELMDAFNHSDWDKMRAMVAPDLVYTETGTGRRLEGVDAYMEACETWKRAFPDVSGVTRELVTSGDIVAQEIHWEGTHTGPFQTSNGTIEATNRRTATDASHWIRFNGDVAREIHHYIDVFSLLAQIGALQR